MDGCASKMPARSRQAGHSASRSCCSVHRRTPELRISINVSTRNLRHRHFPAMVQRLLAERDLAPSILEIELTESAFAVQQKVATEVISEPRTLGVGMAMDDFGSGYSSFSRLLNTPVDTLKIDQSLIHNMTNDDRNFLVIRTIIDLCGSHSQAGSSSPIGGCRALP